MLMPLTAEDVVVGIFYHLKKRDTKTVSADRESLHRWFFTLKREIPQIMTVFTFRDREQFPESAQLDQALSNLDASGLISRQNITPRYYKFEDPLVDSYEQFSNKILREAGVADSDVESAARKIEILTQSNP